jgi:hypothetical protein
MDDEGNTGYPERVANSDADNADAAWGDTEESDDTQIITPGTPISFVDVIKGELQELQESKEVYIAVKGYERSGLHIKYRLPHDGKVLDDISRKVMREHKDSYNRNLYISMDTMIRLCEGLYVQPPESEGEYVELDPELKGEPVQFDARLAEIVSNGSQISSARQVVFALFGNNEMMILSHAERLNRWLMNTKADVETELWQQLGE